MKAKRLCEHSNCENAFPASLHPEKGIFLCEEHQQKNLFNFNSKDEFYKKKRVHISFPRKYGQSYKIFISFGDVVKTLKFQRLRQTANARSFLAKHFLNNGYDVIG